MDVPFPSEELSSASSYKHAGSSKYPPPQSPTTQVWHKQQSKRFPSSVILNVTLRCSSTFCHQLSSSWTAPPLFPFHSPIYLGLMDNIFSPCSSYKFLDYQSLLCPPLFFICFVSPACHVIMCLRDLGRFLFCLPGSLPPKTYCCYT